MFFKLLFKMMFNLGSGPQAGYYRQYMLEYCHLVAYFKHITAGNYNRIMKGEAVNRNIVTFYSTYCSWLRSIL